LEHDDMALDLLKMRYFTKIAELGSFTRASGELGVAQPALSLHMRGLEEQLGVQLLNRTPRGVIATEAGRTLLVHAQFARRFPFQSLRNALNGFRRSA
jgi:LysR family nitrogen assimilation transcriptional regulator